jgi:hypothetical protein
LKLKAIDARLEKRRLADGLFVGQTPKFFQVVQQLAEEADAAERE